MTDYDDDADDRYMGVMGQSFLAGDLSPVQLSD